MGEGLRCIASWIVPAGSVCFQLMEAPDASALTGWTPHWDDLVDFEVVAVEGPPTSGDGVAPSPCGTR